MTKEERKELRGLAEIVGERAMSKEIVIELIDDCERLEAELEIVRSQADASHDQPKLALRKLLEAIDASVSAAKRLDRTRNDLVNKARKLLGK